MKIGIFDSGIGGTTIMRAIKKLLPKEEYKYIADSKNCPYGEKSDQELQKIVAKNTEELIDWGAEIIVVACNTATVRCIDYLRKKYPNIKFVGTEPAIKLATNTNAKKILVLATPGTVESERTQKLKKENQKPGQKITLLACPGLANAIEKNVKLDQKYRPLPLSKQASMNIGIHLLMVLSSAGEIDDPDVIVLGCTHYSLIRSEIQHLFSEAKLIDGSNGVAKRVKELL